MPFGFSVHVHIQSRHLPQAEGGLFRGRPAASRTARWIAPQSSSAPCRALADSRWLKACGRR